MAGNINWATIAPSTALQAAQQSSGYSGPLARDPRVPVPVGYHGLLARDPSVPVPADTSAVTVVPAPAAAAPSQMMAMMGITPNANGSYSAGGPATYTPGGVPTVSPTGASVVPRAAGQIAHFLAPAPQSVAQATAPIVAPPPAAGQEISEKVTKLLGHDHIPLPALSQLASMIPLYKTPLDAKNRAGMEIMSSADALFQAEMAAAGNDAAKQTAAFNNRITNLNRAMGVNPLADQIANGIQQAQGAQ